MEAGTRGTRLEAFGNLVAHPTGNNLLSLGYWVFVVSIFYFVIPALCIRFLFRQRLADFGLNFRTEEGFWKIFAFCVALMLPLVYWMSTTGAWRQVPIFQGL